MSRLPYYIEINIFCIVLLAIIIAASYRTKYERPGNKTFRGLLVVTIIMCAADMFAGILRGNTFYGAKALLYIFNDAFLLMELYASAYCLTYTIQSLNEKPLSRKGWFIVQLPTFILAILIVLDPLTKWFFTIDENNLYERGNLIIIEWIYTYSFLLISSILSLIKVIRSNGKDRNALALTLFILAPAAAGIVQCFNYGISLIQLGMVVSEFVLYILAQNQQIFTDGLTRIPNRYSFNKIISAMMRLKDKSIYLIMMDINHFKMLNDEYGHTIGDEYLIMLADALNNVRRMTNDDFIAARYGGDEFVIVGQSEDYSKPEEIVRLINAELSILNNKKNLPVKLSVSSGIEQGKISSYESSQQLISLADKKMYFKKAVSEKSEAEKNVIQEQHSVIHTANEKSEIIKALEVTTKDINKSVMIIWLAIISVLTVGYLIEVIRKDIGILYYVEVLLTMYIPWLVSLGHYIHRKDSNYLRYIMAFGYLIMYAFVMITSDTNLVFSYALVFVSFLVMYHQPSLIIGYGSGSVLIAAFQIVYKTVIKPATEVNIREYELEILLLIFCFAGAYIAARIYDRASRTNNVYIEELHEKNVDISHMAISSIITIAGTIDAKDPYTKGHSDRVALYSKMMAERLNLPKETIDNIYYTGLLHDIGKINVPDAILNKPGRLTDEEYNILKGHTTKGGEILKDFSFISGIDVGAKYHHERYDGRGYPDGLKGEEIPYIARIIACADAFDAMTSNRCYRAGLPKEKVMSELEKGKGTQFDPAIVQVLIDLYKNDEVPVKQD